MIRILMSGCSGRMGKVIAELAADDPEVTIAAGVDVFGESGAFPVFRTFAEVDVETDVIVDFSSPKAFDDMMAFAREKKLPVVLCTTGLSEEQIGSLAEVKDLILNGKKRIRNCVGVIRIMGNAGLKHAGEADDLTIDWLTENMDPHALMGYQMAVIACLSKESASQAAKEETEEKERDLVLEEIEEKKDPVNSHTGE